MAAIHYVSCHGLRFGGPTLRCAETARLIKGVDASCTPSCDADKLARLPHRPAARVHTAAERARAARDTVVAGASASSSAVVFIKDLPSNLTALRALRGRACTVRLDLLDIVPDRLRALCRGAALRLIDGVFADNAVSWVRLRRTCPALGSLPVDFVEHWHSMPRPVADGSNALARALLLHEHRTDSATCDELRAALAPTAFDCITSGVDHRLALFRSKLNMTAAAVRAEMERPGGTGALFARLFGRYDLLVVWKGTENTVQRLSNALATGVPVVARRCDAFAAAFERHGVLFAGNATELGRRAAELRDSLHLRRRASEVGIAAAAQYSLANISQAYIRAIHRALPRPNILALRAARGSISRGSDELGAPTGSSGCGLGDTSSTFEPPSLGTPDAWAARRGDFWPILSAVAVYEE